MGFNSGFKGLKVAHNSKMRYLGKIQSYC